MALGDFQVALTFDALGQENAAYPVARPTRANAQARNAPGEYDRVGGRGRVDEDHRVDKEFCAVAEEHVVVSIDRLSAARMRLPCDSSNSADVSRIR